MADFVERGMATFGESIPNDELVTNTTLKWGARDDIKSKKSRQEAEKQLIEKENLLKLLNIEKEMMKKHLILKDKYEITKSLAHSCSLSLSYKKLKHNKIKSFRKFRVYKSENIKNLNFNKFYNEKNSDSDSEIDSENNNNKLTNEEIQLKQLSNLSKKSNFNSKSIHRNHHLYIRNKVIHQNEEIHDELEKSILQEKIYENSSYTLSKFDRMKSEKLKKVSNAILSSLYLDEEGCVTVGGVGFARTRNAVKALFESGLNIYI